MTYECHITIAVKHAGHSRDYNALRTDMDWLVSLLTEGGVPVLRSKIEHIIYDTKTGVDVYAS
jgi:hypothetical protein